ncbi:MAG: FadR/GntR family transcriptional regulator [Candidatus Bipolaricaulia bacterium]
MSWDTRQSAISPSPKKSELAFRYLDRLLRDYPAGARLPSEREVAGRLKITRSPVREALVALERTGRVRIEPGVGAFAVEPGSVLSATSDFALSAEDESPFEITELRKVLESGILPTAIAELTPESLRSIEEAFERMAEAQESQDMDRFLTAHREFHLAIAVASGNTLFERLARWVLCRAMTQPVWAEVMQRRLQETSTHLADSIDEHREILEAIRSRNSRLAQALMAGHFAGVG